jgi:hypothetical protein
MRALIKSTLSAVILLVTGLGSAVAFGSEVDSRFDGRWVGVEIFRYGNGFAQLAGKVPQVTTTLGISQSGQVFAVLAGYGAGRYKISEKSHGNTIVIDSVNRSCKFVLSRDGNIVKEFGSAPMGLNLGMPPWQVSATFRRVDK